ncbi:IPT/TIG domain-containing protein [bacterium]
MKSNQLIYTGLLLVGIIFLSAGCEYDTPISLWDPAAEGLAPSATISEVDPPNEAGGGINEIIIKGSNFASDPMANSVYFNSVPAEIVSGNSGEVVVFRPPIVGDSLVIKVIVPGGLIIAEHGPYRVTKLFENYTEEFDDTGDLRNFVIGSDGTYYSIMRNRTLRRRLPGSDEEETVANVTERNIGNIHFGPDGNLYYNRSNNFGMYKINLIDFSEESYATLPASVSYFDFDENGYAYFVGNGVGLYCLKSPEDIQVVDDYSTLNCLAACVYDGSFYVLAAYTGDDLTVPMMAIWKNDLNGDGTVAGKTLFLDWSASEYSEASPTDLEFAADGTLYISSDHEQPIVRFENGQLKPLYKDMISGPVSLMDWGHDNHLYFYSNVQSFTDKNVYKVDMGQPGAL